MAESTTAPWDQQPTGSAGTTWDQASTGPSASAWDQPATGSANEPDLPPLGARLPEPTEPEPLPEAYTPPPIPDEGAIWPGMRLPEAPDNSTSTDWPDPLGESRSTSGTPGFSDPPDQFGQSNYDASQHTVSPHDGSHEDPSHEDPSRQDPAALSGFGYQVDSGYQAASGQHAVTQSDFGGTSDPGNDWRESTPTPSQQFTLPDSTPHPYGGAYPDRSDTVEPGPGAGPSAPRDSYQGSGGSGSPWDNFATGWEGSQSVDPSPPPAAVPPGDLGTRSGVYSHAKAATELPPWRAFGEPAGDGREDSVPSQQPL
ncbi:MAG TPA: hypothetical protein VHJ83_05255, partial [Micromonosporaceae bacterium]|nr:hypothetical protein [Micromonosporaceae bacterium]